MYFRSIETSTARMNAHNESAKAAAAFRLKRLEHKRRPECAKNSTAAARLDARVKDWDRSVNDPSNRTKVMSDYNKPGSMKLQ